MAWGDRKKRREEAAKASRDAKKFSKPGSVPRRQEGRGTCRVCKVKDGHAGWCVRNS